MFPTVANRLCLVEKGYCTPKCMLSDEEKWSRYLASMLFVEEIMQSNTVIHPIVSL